jgi:hypothetical protein
MCSHVSWNLPYRRKAFRSSGVTRHVRHAFQGARDHELAIPRVHENADFSARRQCAPVTPRQRARELFLRALAKRVRADVTRIHPFVKRIRGFPAAAPFDATDQQQDRHALLREHLELVGQQRLAHLRYFAGEHRLPNLVPDFGGFEHPVGSYSVP